MTKLYIYEYDGPVTVFNVCTSNNWRATTRAVSANKALANLKYRYGKETGKCIPSGVGLPGKLECKGEA